MNVQNVLSIYAMRRLTQLKNSTEYEIVQIVGVIKYMYSRLDRMLKLIPLYHTHAVEYCITKLLQFFSIFFSFLQHFLSSLIR